MRAEHPQIHQRIGMLTTWAIVPLIVAIALLLYALNNDWFWGALFGIGWLTNIVICVTFIFWVVSRGNNNEKNRKRV